MKDVEALISFTLPRRDRLLFGLAAAVLVLCLLFGGWDRPGIFSDAVLQLAAVPLLLLALWRLWGGASSVRGALAFCLAVVLVPLLQLMPLPPQIWTALPARDLVERSLSLAGEEIGWRPTSLTPHATWLSLLSLVPPLALFLATLRLSWRKRRTLILLMLGIGVFSCFLGLSQVAQGPGGWLAGIGLASSGSAEGFFVNRNLFAAFLYSVLVFAAAFAIDNVKTLSTQSARTAETRTLVVAVVSFVVLVALLGTQMMTQSRGGIALTIVALVGIAALARSDGRGTSALGAKRLVGGAVALVLLFSLQFVLYRVMERFAKDPLEDARVALARNTWDAAQAMLPFGSGLGSFVPVYQFFEKPQDALVDTYVNRAHNDVLEVALETGVVGIALMALFAIWVGVKVWQVWRTEGLGGAPLDVLLVRAASLVLLLLMLHSLVDYPLRTTAMMAVFAVACGLLFEPVGRGSKERDLSDAFAEDEVTRQTASRVPSGRTSVREPSFSGADAVPPRASSPGPEGSRGAAWGWPGEPTPARSEPTPATAPARDETPARRPGQDSERWGTDIAWPDAWRRPQGPVKRKESEDEPG